MKVFDIEKDGIYDKNDSSLVGRIAFIFDGCIVSGWALDDKGEFWEADSDVGRHGRFTNVKKYVVFDKPVWEL